MDVDLTEDEIQAAFSGIFDEAVPNELHVKNLRFARTSEVEIEEHLKERIPPKTKSKQRWCVNLFKTWHSEWKARLDGQLKVFDELEEMDNGNLCYCLKFFIADIRKTTGERYPPQTLKSIFYMIQHYLQYDCKRDISLLKSNAFKEARDVLDAEMRFSAKDGNVKVPLRAKAITYDDEEELWNEGILGSENAKQLQETVIFLLGIHCGLRAATEHRALVYGNNSQIKIAEEEGKEVLIYTEAVSKNKHYGIKQARMEPKVVRILPNEKSPERCIISLYKKYVSHRPSNMPDGPFHLGCLENPRNSTWYKKQPLGIHQIEKVTQNLMKRLGKEGYYTNTSLRRTSKSRMVAAGIPREITKKRIGHLSKIDTVYIDEHVMERKISDALYGNGSNSGECSGTTTTAIDKDSEQRPKLIFNNCTFQGCSFNL